MKTAIWPDASLQTDSSSGTSASPQRYNAMFCSGAHTLHTVMRLRWTVCQTCPATEPGGWQTKSCRMIALATLWIFLEACFSEALLWVVRKRSLVFIHYSPTLWIGDRSFTPPPTPPTPSVYLVAPINSICLCQGSSNASLIMHGWNIETENGQFIQ